MQIKLNEEINLQDPEEKTPDHYVKVLLNEISGREDSIRFLMSYLENAPFKSSFTDSQGMDQNSLDAIREISRMNLARLIVAATTDRLGVEGFRTGASNDETGDQKAMEAFARDEMNIKATYGMQLACEYRTSYLVVDPLAKRQNIAPPTNAAVINDVFGEPLIGLTLQQDRFLNRDILKLYVRDRDAATGEAKGPVRMFIASRELTNADSREQKGRTRTQRRRAHGARALRVTNYDSEVPLDRGLKKNWEWWRVGDVKGLTRIPITPLVNRDGKSEFEDHVDIIDRIHYMIFQRLLIVTMQSLKQRAIETAEGNPLPRADHNGQPIDYNEEFSAEPGAVWALPPGAKIWESSNLDISSILAATKDDIRDLFSQSYTNLAYASDSVNQSAAGSNNQQEAYISKIEDRRRRFESRLARHMSVYFEVTGDTERSDISKLEVIWPSAKIESLIDKSAAFAALKSSGVPLTTALREGLGMNPQEIMRVEQELFEEQINKALDQALNGPTPIEKGQQQSTGAGGNGGTASARAQSGANQSKPKG